MREILFRGFHPDKNGPQKVFVDGKWIEGFWVYGNLIQTPSNKCLILKNDVDLFGVVPISVIPETVGEFTALTDKNGTKIFEGDIVKCQHIVWNTSTKKDYSNIRYSYGGELVSTTPEELVEFFGMVTSIDIGVITLSNITKEIYVCITKAVHTIFRINSLSTTILKLSATYTKPPNY